MRLFTALILIMPQLATIAGAQEPRSSLAATQNGRMLAMVFPAGAAPAVRLNELFDASRQRANVVPETAIPAPRPSRRPRTIKNTEILTPARLHQELVVPVPEASAAYRRTFRRLLAHPERTDRWDELILKYARYYRLDARLLKSIMAAESEFNRRAVSPKGAQGLMQVMPRTAQWMGVAGDLLEAPEMAIKAGAAYLQYLLKRAWNRFHLRGVRYTDAPHWVIQRVLAAYHAGPRFLWRNCWFRSTRAYVRKVLLFYQSRVTDLRRPNGRTISLPSFGDAVAPSGVMN